MFGENCFTSLMLSIDYFILNNTYCCTLILYISKMASKSAFYCEKFLAPVAYCQILQFLFFYFKQVMTENESVYKSGTSKKKAEILTPREKFLETNSWRPIIKHPS